MEAETSTPDVLMRRYLLTIAIVMAALYCIPFLVVRTDFYKKWNPSFYSRSLNYAYDATGQNADVVIFGDSTALLGIDPSQISSALGVKVINLPNTLSTLRVNDDEVLRRYLRANRPPRLIVFYFAPWVFDYGNMDLNAGMMYEGEEMLAARGTPQQIMAFVRQHPLDTVAFPLRLYLAVWKAAEPRISYRYQDRQLRATFGHIDNIDPTPLNSDCRFPSFAIDHIHFSWVHSLGEKYRSPNTKIFFYSAPVPACANVSSVVQRPYDQLPAAPPKQVATSLFGNNVLFIHPRQSAVPAMTQDLIDAMRPVLDNAPPK